MKKERTQDEINRQMEGLKKMKTTLPQFSKFGGANWSKIDAQLDILEDERDPDDFYQAEDAEEFEDGDNDIYWDAVKAKDWLDGSEDDDLFEE